VTRTTIRGAELAYDLAGSGPDVVLLHSSIADRRMWDPQLPILTPGHRVLGLDLRGFGESSLPEGEFSWRADVAELMASLGMGRALVVGSSMGGRIAIDLAIERPEAIRGLVLIGAGIGGVAFSEELQRAIGEIDGLAEGGAAEDAVERELRLWVDGPRRLPGTVGGATREYLRAADLAATRRVPEHSRAAPVPLRPPAAGRLEEIVAPTLVVVGEYDVPDMVTNARELARRLPRAELVVIADTAHFPSLERSDEFNAHLARFIGRLDRSDG
jgi:pimeloyl-ACP methyl ester carboxylesterase